jgi:hypothetical protein
VRSSHSPDQIAVCFDDDHAVADAGLILAATPAGGAPAPGAGRHPATRYLNLPGRLTRSARRWRLHLPTRWPWAHQFLLALDRLRCVPFPT